MNVAAGEVTSRGTTRTRSPASWRCWTSAPCPASGRVSLGSCRRDWPGSAIGGSRSTSVTTRSFRPDEVSESFVTVTLPFHPLAGRRLRVLGQQRTHRGLELDCDGGDLGRVRLPAAWTDRCRRRPRAGAALATGPAPSPDGNACFLIDADQYGAGRRVQAQAADVPRPCPEARFVGPVEPSSHLVRARVRIGQEPADRCRRQVHASFAQLSGKQCMRPASPRHPAASGLRLSKCLQLVRSRASPG
jgi:hypothetical protein